MEAEHSEAVLETLENTFGEVIDKSSMEIAIALAVENVVTDNLSDYMDQMAMLRKEFGGDDTDNFMSKLEFKNLVIASIDFILTVRLDLDITKVLGLHDMTEKRRTEVVLFLVEKKILMHYC